VASGRLVHVYRQARSTYIKATCAAQSSQAFEAKDFAMRAEVEKLADAIRQSLALLRRHL
jgi:hypothetical protein